MLLTIFRSGLREPSEMRHSNLVKSVRVFGAGRAITWADSTSATMRIVVTSKNLIKRMPLADCRHLCLADCLELLRNTNENFPMCVFDMLLLRQDGS